MLLRSVRFALLFLGIAAPGAVAQAPPFSFSAAPPSAR